MEKIKGESFSIFFQAFQPPATKKWPPPAVDSRLENRLPYKGRAPSWNSRTGGRRH